jgi:hypothetical protein
MRSNKTCEFEISDKISGSSLLDLDTVYLIPVLSTSSVKSTPVDGHTRVLFEVENKSSVTALDDFALLVMPHRNGAFHNWLSGTDWASAAGMLRKVVGAPKTLAAGAVAAALVEVGPAVAIKFQAKSAGTTILANGGFTGNANSWTLGSGWAYGTNNVTATAASTTLKQAKADMSSPWTTNLYYYVTFTISGYSAGSLQIGTNTDPSQHPTDIAADGTYVIPILSDSHADGLVFTGTGFSGTIDTISAIEVPVLDVRGSVYHD